ncbi:MAG TPA: Uma2 family endonuclease [Dehalococcoidia bacterium]|nr:Uma2 family endonuclease [Dehalococcoidia bacterium]
MVTNKRLLKAEDLLDLPDDGRSHELIDGELVEMSSAGGQHGAVLVALVAVLDPFIEENELGRLLGGDTGIVLSRDPDTVLGPDLCFFARGRLPDDVPDNFIEIIPDFVIEIDSPSDRAGDVYDKVQKWLEAGVRQVWNVYPRRRSIVAYSGRNEVRTFRATDMIDAAPVLPDFRCPVARLFR